MHTKTIRWENEDGEELETVVPAAWEICCTCNGEGKHSRALGAFTSSEWADEDPDFREDYMTGRYDESCDECRGTGKVLVMAESDDERLSPEQRDAIKHVERCARMDRDDARTQRAECGYRD